MHMNLGYEQVEIEGLNLGYEQVEIEGLTLFVHPLNGRVFPQIRGAEGDEGDPPPSFTQADMDRIAGQAREEGRQRAARDLAESLGCTVDEAKTKLDKLAADEAARMDDLQRAQQAQATAEAAAQQAADEAARIRTEHANTLALTAAGVNPAHITDALRLLDVPADADDAARTAAVEALKGRMAPLFSTGTPAPPAPGANPPAPPTPPGPPGGGQSPAERAQARFKALNPSRTAA